MSKTDKDDEEKDDKNDTPDPTTASLTPAQASAIALAAYPGGSVVGIPALEDEDGVAVYGVEVTVAGKTFDVKVNANTGKIVKTEEGDDRDGDAGSNDGPDDGDSDGK